MIETFACLFLLSFKLDIFISSYPSLHCLEQYYVQADKSSSTFLVKKVLEVEVHIKSEAFKVLFLCSSFGIPAHIIKEELTRYQVRAPSLLLHLTQSCDLQ